MKWDAKKRRYVDAQGRVLRASEVRKHVDDYIQKEQKEVDRKAQKFIAGAITAAAFFTFLRQKITAWHSVTGTIAYGGESQMGDIQNERINRRILSELTFLQGFEADAERSIAAAESLATQVASGLDIPAGLETVVEERLVEALRTAAPSEVETIARQVVKEALADSLGAEEAVTVAESVTVASEGIAQNLIGATIPARAQMYTEAAYATYENNVSARESDAGAMGVRRICEEDEASCDECVAAATPEYVDFADIPDIGSLTCLNNCRCSFEFSYHGVEPLTVDRRLTG